MSLNLIKADKTTYENLKGVVWYNNPSVSVTITSEGKVFRGYDELKPRNNGQYYFNIKDDISDSWKSWNASFTSLYSRMVLGVSLGCGKTLQLKDELLGYVDGNVMIVPKTKVAQEASGRMYGHNYEKPKSLNPKNETLYYTQYESKNEHITEDGAVFPNKELAEWHQTNVSKGKGNAQIVLDYNGGYVLAEQIYLQEVKYNKERPYVNFIDVMNNNDGVVSNVQNEECVFDKISTQEDGLCSLMNFGLGGLYGLRVSKFKADKIQHALENCLEAQKEFNNSVNILKSFLNSLES